MADLRTLLGDGAYFEAPRWHDGRWWVSDFYRRAVLTVTPDGREEEVMRVAGQPSGLGWMPDGSLLVVSMKDHRLCAARRTASASSPACWAATTAGRSCSRPRSRSRTRASRSVP